MDASMGYVRRLSSTGDIFNAFDLANAVIEKDDQVRSLKSTFSNHIYKY
jgi:hypothetical protein